MPGRPILPIDLGADYPPPIRGIGNLPEMVRDLALSAKDGFGGLSQTNLEVLVDRRGRHLSPEMRAIWCELATIYSNAADECRQELNKNADS